ncbi:uncharacterized protein LOC120067656 [Benincasa hispida]|uniref:uncharacterized protein LOC120067656 n=1 Tax=Benincasa hispida TaxID=102211 RepID=UPI0018FF73E2|nr:uncharacterized protein LOC120067656 [Benincasa hispida]
MLLLVIFLKRVFNSDTTLLERNFGGWRKFEERIEKEALRSLGNNQFVRGLGVDGKTDCLNACEKNIVDGAKIEVVEIYDEKPLVLASSHGKKLKDSDDKVSVKLSVEDTVTNVWSNTMTEKLGVKTPFEGRIEVSANLEGTGMWRETTQMKSLMEITHDVIVPKRLKLKASIFGTQGTCDIPFSYTHKDELFNGRTVIRRLHDGLFTGINCYNFKFVAEQESL